VLPPPSAVKRPYDASRRKARAEQARRRVLDAARRLFLAQGYAGTTVAEVATAAGVSVESVYKAHGSKARLTLALFHDAIAGQDDEPAELRADRISSGEPDPRKRLRAFGGLVAEVTPRVVPVMLLVRAAAVSDPESAAVWRQMLDERLARMADHARRLADDGQLRPGVTVEEARDVLWLYSAPEVYELMVDGRGWSAERFGAWVGEAYVRALLPPDAGTGSARFDEQGV
jgi:AcrR family transcriptional regulator